MMNKNIDNNEYIVIIRMIMNKNVYTNNNNSKSKNFQNNNDNYKYYNIGTILFYFSAGQALIILHFQSKAH